MYFQKERSTLLQKFLHIMLCFQNLLEISLPNITVERLALVLCVTWVNLTPAILFSRLRTLGNFHSLASPWRQLNLAQDRFLPDYFQFIISSNFAQAVPGSSLGGITKSNLHTFSALSPGLCLKSNLWGSISLWSAFFHIHTNSLTTNRLEISSHIMWHSEKVFK
jgi:hypothetical protein